MHDTLSNVTSPKIKARFLYNTHSDQELARSKVIVPISIGNTSYESIRLTAILNFLNKKVGQCDVVIADTLQRHNLRISNPDLTESELILKTKKMGQDWLARNQYSFLELTQPHHVFYWDEYLKNIQFNEAHEKIIQLYRENQEFQMSVQNTIANFTHRSSKWNPNGIDQKDCTAYLLEETAILILLFAEHQYNFIVYPNDMLPCLKCAREFFLTKTSPDLVEWLRVYVRTKK
jgi:tRNA-dependent cyclodipeptide synthase